MEKVRVGRSGLKSRYGNSGILQLIAERLNQGESESFCRSINGLERRGHSPCNRRGDQHSSLAMSDHIPQNPLCQVNCGGDIELDHVQLCVEIGLADEVPAYSDAGIDRDCVDIPAGLFDRTVQLLDSVILRQIGLNRLYIGANLAQFGDCVVDLLTVGGHKEVITILGENASQLITNPAGGSSHHCKKLCISSCHFSLPR